MKVLFITQNIPHYRFELYQRLSKVFDLTIIHSGKEVPYTNIHFKQIKLPLRKFGPFHFFLCNLNKICRNYDVVVSEANLHYIDRNILIVNPFRRYRWISWGIGVSASYKKKYDSVNTFNKIRYFVFKKADANIFYSEYPLKKYLSAGFKNDSLFVANNTMFVNYDESKDFNKEKLLFVGTLYKQKKIFKLLDAYKAAYQSKDNFLPLHIIGDGSERNSVEKWITENKFQNHIKLLGPIYEDKLLEEHFRKSYACISPGQAGLSVLMSMGYGTPFITKKDAITGGEIFNIKNHVNGIIYDNDDELVTILNDIFFHKEKFRVMGENARKYYIEKRQINEMVNEIGNAVKYVLNNKDNSKSYFGCITN